MPSRWPGTGLPRLDVAVDGDDQDGWVELIEVLVGLALVGVSLTGAIGRVAEPTHFPWGEPFLLEGD